MSKLGDDGFCLTKFKKSLKKKSVEYGFKAKNSKIRDEWMKILRTLVKHSTQHMEHLQFRRATTLEQKRASSAIFSSKGVRSVSRNTSLDFENDENTCVSQINEKLSLLKRQYPLHPAYDDHRAIISRMEDLMGQLKILISLDPNERNQHTSEDSNSSLHFKKKPPKSNQIRKLDDFDVQDVIKMQRIIRRWLFAKHNPHLASIARKLLSSTVSQRDRQRNAIWREIISSEREYMKTLKFIQKHYMIPGLSSGTRNSTEIDNAFALLFVHLKDISDISSKMLEALEFAQESWPSKTKLGGIFLELAPRMADTYIPYISMYVFTLKKTMGKKKRDLKKLFKTKEGEISSNYFFSMLFLPIGRLLKYEWLFKELIELTPPDHVDLPDLQEAFEKLQRINITTEVGRKAAERFEKVLNINLNFSTPMPELLDPQREWIREGPIMQVFMTGPEKSYMYLMSDIIIVTKLLPNESKQFDKIIKLANSVVSDVKDVGFLRNTFKIKHREGISPSSVYYFCASTLEEKKSWISDISRTIKHNAESAGRYQDKKEDILHHTPTKINKGTSLTWVLEKNPVCKMIVKMPDQFPEIDIRIDSSPIFVFSDSGPTNEFDRRGANGAPMMPNCVHACSVSTYPEISPGQRDGDPICDHYSIQVYENVICVALADGCNWGIRPQRAATKASKAFAKYLITNFFEFSDLKNIGHHLLLAANAAHSAIIKGFEDDVWQAGTTTLLGGMMVELQPANINDPSWGFIFLSVGDCKAFHWKRKNGRVTDITASNRGTTTDAQDPGGRLGPYLRDGAPDLRNLMLYFYPCEPGDICFIASDGVHDNFDPQQLGKLPSEVGRFSESSWADLEGIPAAEKAKSTFCTKLMEELINQKDLSIVSPKTLCESLIDYCVETTRACREYMEKHRGKKQPSDYRTYPGKVDHTSCVAFEVGKVECNDYVFRE